jgi:hypothetical protein
VSTVANSDSANISRVRLISEVAGYLLDPNVLSERLKKRPDCP